jgi:acyl-coenzyme A synthetase/AMP-(fatty) acid ligase
MGRRIFSRWIDGPHGCAAPEKRGVHINGQFASWASLAGRASTISQTLVPGALYVVDPSVGHDAFAALLAVAMTSNTTLVWGKPHTIPLRLTPTAPGLFVSQDTPLDGPLRPRYATATSGTSGAAKIPVAYGEQLELVALQYDLALYQRALPGDAPVQVLATCLPLEYAAVFMMLIVPAMFMAHDLVLFPSYRWDVLHGIAARQRVACLAVPALVTAAHAGTPQTIEMQNCAFIFTAGYLSRARGALIRGKFRGATLLGSYGASETGVMTIDPEPDAHAHVGRAIAGKPIWIAQPDENGIGRVSTTGPDCRDFYLQLAGRIRDEQGAVSSTDYGHLDADCNLYLDGRIDGGSKLHGLTIYPRQIERHILLLPGVEDVRVQLGSSEGSERLEARIVGTVLPDAVREHCRSLPDSCRPTVLECVPEQVAGYSLRGKL